MKRLALGVDMPPEILLGLGATNHWNGWQIDRNAITQHVEPLMGVIVDGIVDSYYRPALLADQVPDADRYVIGFDVSELVNEPDRGPDAILLYDRGELSGEALRREHGFNDSDALTAAQARQKELRELLGHAGIDAATANKLLELLGYVQTGVIPEGTAAPVQVPSTRAPAIPTAPSVHASGCAAAALCYAGKRLLASDRSFRARFRGVPHHELHTRIPVTRDGQYQARFMLDGAFATFDQLPELAPVRDVVERHVEWLLVQGLPLDREHLNREVTSAFRVVTA